MDSQFRFTSELNQVPQGGITDLDGAKQVAKQIFESYDKDKNGLLDSIEIAPMMVDAYRAMNKGFNPSRADVETYGRILDRDQDGKITLKDIEELAVKYLVGESALNQLKSQYSGGSYYQSNYQVNAVKTESFKQAAPQRNPEVERRLEVARRLFYMFDTDHSGYLEEDEIPQLLRQTYKDIGINYNPSQEDIKSWMRMGDTNQDGKISLQEYESLVLRSLERAGIRID